MQSMSYVAFHACHTCTTCSTWCKKSPLSFSWYARPCRSTGTSKNMKNDLILNVCMHETCRHKIVLCHSDRFIFDPVECTHLPQCACETDNFLCQWPTTPYLCTIHMRTKKIHQQICKNEAIQRCFRAMASQEVQIGQPTQTRFSTRLFSFHPVSATPWSWRSKQKCRG